MTRIKKPAKAPKILTTKGSEQTQNDCAAYDRSSNDYRSGSKKFEFNSRIYGAKSVKNVLLKAQHNKCCYCECWLYPLRRSRPYGAVEHFRPKGAVKQSVGQSEEHPGYYWLAYDWSNLLVSCGPCNSSDKGILFPLSDNNIRAHSHHDPIEAEQPLFVNPAIENPQEHIRFRDETPEPITEKGRTTIEGLGLRKSDEDRRTKLEILKTLRFLVKLGERSTDPKKQDDAEAARKFLSEAVLPEAEYSAMAQGFLDSDSYSARHE